MPNTVRIISIKSRLNFDRNRRGTSWGTRGVVRAKGKYYTLRVPPRAGLFGTQCFWADTAGLR